MILDLLFQALSDTISPMSTVLIMLFLTGFLLELDAFSRISHLAGPLVSLSHLPAASASSFVVSLGSALAANTMIAGLKEEGHLSERQVFLSAIMNSVPVYFRELFTYQLAFVIPLLGLFVGGAYALISIATGLIKLALVMVLGRAYLDSDSTGLSPALASSSRWEGQEIGPSTGSSLPPSPDRWVRYSAAARRSIKRQRRIFLRIAGLYFVMTFLVLYLSQEGILQSLDVTALASFFSVPPETIIPLTVYVASPKAGITLLGPLIENGGISETKAIMVLMLGSLFMLPFYSLRSLLPNYTGVFGMRLGIYLVLVSTSISMLVRMSVLVALMIVT